MITVGEVKPIGRKPSGIGILWYKRPDYTSTTAVFGGRLNDGFYQSKQVSYNICHCNLPIG